MFNKQMFSNRLKTLRDKEGLNQTDLADKLKISRGSISYYEKGERLPDIETIYNMAQLFKVSADYLIGLSDVASTDTNIKTVCQFVGLTEKAVKKLRGHYISGKEQDEVYKLDPEFDVNGQSLDTLLFNNINALIESELPDDIATTITKQTIGETLLDIIDVDCSLMSDDDLDRNIDILKYNILGLQSSYFEVQQDVVSYIIKSSNVSLVDLKNKLETMYKEQEKRRK